MKNSTKSWTNLLLLKQDFKMLQKGEQWADDVVEITQSVWDNSLLG